MILKMKKKIIILMIGLLLIVSSVSAQVSGVKIDSFGNISTGAANEFGSLEVTGQTGSDGIIGITNGDGAGVRGENGASWGELGASDGESSYGVWGFNPGGQAAYFDGNAQVTGNLIVNTNLTVNGTITGFNETDPTVNALGKATTLATCQTGQYVTWSGSIWTCGAAGGGGGSGDITGVTALDGLSGGGIQGNVFLSVNFAGTGSAITASKSDHNHDYTYAAVITDLQNRIAALEAKLAKVTTDGNNIYITGANLHVRNASGSTYGSVDSLGNIIIGYNETRGGAADNRSGSHNLVLGMRNNYSSFGGIVLGHFNSISADHASITGGESNTASARFATITGGTANTASHLGSTVIGGLGNSTSSTPLYDIKP
jgi:hypothetical protein